MLLLQVAAPSLAQLAPLALIFILILAAAGLTRGADIFQFLGVGSLLSIGRVGAGGAGKGLRASSTSRKVKGAVAGTYAVGAPVAGLIGVSAGKAKQGVQKAVGGVAEKSAAKNEAGSKLVQAKAEAAAKRYTNTGSSGEFPVGLGAIYTKPQEGKVTMSTMTTLVMREGRAAPGSTRLQRFKQRMGFSAGVTAGEQRSLARAEREANKRSVTSAQQKARLEQLSEQAKSSNTLGARLRLRSQQQRYTKSLIKESRATDEWKTQLNSALSVMYAPHSQSIWTRIFSSKASRQRHDELQRIVGAKSDAQFPVFPIIVPIAGGVIAASVLGGSQELGPEANAIMPGTLREKLDKRGNNTVVLTGTAEPKKSEDVVAPGGKKGAIAGSGTVAGTGKVSEPSRLEVKLKGASAEEGNVVAPGATGKSAKPEDIVAPGGKRKVRAAGTSTEKADVVMPGAASQSGKPEEIVAPGGKGGTSTEKGNVVMPGTVTGKVKEGQFVKSEGTAAPSSTTPSIVTIAPPKTVQQRITEKFRHHTSAQRYRETRSDTSVLYAAALAPAAGAIALNSFIKKESVTPPGGPGYSPLFSKTDRGTPASPKPKPEPTEPRKSFTERIRESRARSDELAVYGNVFGGKPESVQRAERNTQRKAARQAERRERQERVAQVYENLHPEKEYEPPQEKPATIGGQLGMAWAQKKSVVEADKAERKSKKREKREYTAFVEASDEYRTREAERLRDTQHIRAALAESTRHTRDAEDRLRHAQQRQDEAK